MVLTVSSYWLSQWPTDEDANEMLSFGRGADFSLMKHKVTYASSMFLHSLCKI
jgi:hypothetical protein